MHRIGPTSLYTSLFLGPLALAVIAMSPVPALAADAPHTITVSGQGEIKAVPDEAILTAGVVTQAATAGDALAANRRAMNGVFAELKRQGIPDKAIQTSEFNVSPQYETGKDANAPPKIVSYQVSDSVSVTVDDLSKLGAAIDALVSSGANSMGGISFTIRDPKPSMRLAREAAVKDAMDRAGTYAKAAGLALGRITAIDEGGEPSNSIGGVRFERFTGTLNAPTPIAAGEQTISAHVTVTFEIK
jgi:uncharacterized protein